MNPKIILLSIVCALISCFSAAQQTIVTGTVKDSISGEPLAFVSVYFSDSKTGTNTDVDGNFRLATYYATDTLIFQYTGYNFRKVRIRKDESQELNIRLSPSSVGLGEVVIKADKDAENPAHPIMRRVLRNKKINNREKLMAYEYEAYNKVEFDLNNLSEEFKNRKVMRNFDFVFDHIDSTGEKPYLPVFIMEAVSDFYFRRDPKATYEIIKATRVSGVENQSISQFLGDMYQNINIYDNNIIAFQRSFISPISVNSFLYYDYYLSDSLFIDNDYCYQIDYFPKRKQEPTFKGTLWIHDTTYAVKKVTVGLPELINLNFVNSFEIEQTFSQVEHEVWMLTRDRMVIDFNLSEKTMGLYGRKNTTYKNFVVNSPRPIQFYNRKDNISLQEGVNVRSDVYWDSIRHEPLSLTELSIYTMIDSVKNVRQFKTFIDLLNFFINGYHIVGNFEIGPYSTFYSYNPIEGNRFRFGGRTSNQFSRRILLEGYSAYGLLDEKWKYGLGATVNLYKQPRSQVGFFYKNDIEQLGQGQNALRNDNVLASLFRRNPARKLTLTEEYRTFLQHEWFGGFSNRLIFRNRTLTPLGDLIFIRPGGENINSLTTSELGLYTRFAYKERYVSGQFERVSLGTDYPTFEFQLTKGFQDLLNGQYDYGKVVAAISDEFKIGIFGRTTYRLEGGRVFGKVPYPLLEIHNGNETYFYNDDAFNTMNFFEFVSDQWVSAAVTHQFDGLFLNKIPLIRKLKWREVAAIKALAGSYNANNSSSLALPPNIYSLYNGPFAEAAVGVENIFRFLRVDALYRLTYRNHPNITKFGIRMKFQFDF